MSRNPTADPNPAEVAAVQQRCFDLKLKGHSVRAIASMLNMPKSTVQDKLEQAYKDLVQPQAEQARALEVERYDAWLLRLEDKVSTLSASEAGVSLDELCKVTATQVRVSERRAALLGINAPVQVEAVGDLKVTIESVDLDKLT